MPRDKKMTTLFILIVLIAFAIIVGVWWYVFLGRPNPPLSRANISIQSGTASVSGADATATPATTTAMGPTPDGASSSAIAGENPPLPEEGLSISGAAFNVEVASTALEQTRGLSFRPSLGQNDGMLFVFGAGTVQTFWMKDMNFPLDMIWIRGNTVDGFTENIPAPGPGTQVWELAVYPSPPDTDKVLEVSSGTVAKYGIKVGDTVVIGPAQ